MRTGQPMPCIRRVTSLWGVRFSLMIFIIIIFVDGPGTGLRLVLRVWPGLCVATQCDWACQGVYGLHCGEGAVWRGTPQGLAPQVRPRARGGWPLRQVHQDGG